MANANSNRLAVCTSCGSRLHVARVVRPDPDRVVRTKVCPNPGCGARLSTVETALPSAPPAVAATGPGDRVLTTTDHLGHT